jgi:hypothetical protein
VLTGMVGMVEEHSGVISFKSEGIRNCPIVEVEHLEQLPGCRTSWRGIRLNWCGGGTGSRFYETRGIGSY